MQRFAANYPALPGWPPSSEFQDLADELTRNARKRNLDGTTLAYLDLTMNCVKCHKLVRDENLVTLNRKTPEGKF